MPEIVLAALLSKGRFANQDIAICFHASILPCEYLTEYGSNSSIMKVPYTNPASVFIPNGSRQVNGSP
jgi:hypothetical protein